MSLNIIYEKKMEDVIFATDKGRRKRLAFGPHLHGEFELVYLKEGKTLASADSARYELQADDLFLAFPNQIHSYETLESEQYSIFIVKPSMLPELEKVFSFSVPGCSVLHNVSKDFPRIPQLISLLGDVCKNPLEKYEKFATKGLLLALFCEILEHMPLVGLPKEDSDTVRKIISYCAKNFTGALSLSSVSESLHMNKYYISHLFSEKLGMHFTDYINSLRISEAQRYLLNSDHTVTEISTIVGFETLRTFNRAFVKQTGVSPTEFRKLNAPYFSK